LFEACACDVDCSAIAACVEQNCSDATCESNCVDQYPDGKSKYTAFDSCNQSNCAACAF
jgi:hypothetical protein